MAISVGEQVSVALLSAALAGENISPVPLLAFQLGMLTDEYRRRARIQMIKTERIEKSGLGAQAGPQSLRVSGHSLNRAI